MLKISTKSRYGVQACFYLALKNELMNLTELSQSSGVSIKYLEQLFSKLKKGDIVEAIRGASGGYKLTRLAREITLLQIMTALEGDIHMVACKGEDCKNAVKCPTKSIWGRLNSAVSHMLEEITLHDMIQDYKEKNECGDVRSSLL